MKHWSKLEDEKYSLLYKNNYPVGQPMRCVKKYNLPKDLNCIDLGCGKASLSTYFSNYTGVDVSGYIIEKNKRTRSGQYHHASLDDLYFITDSFDLAICSDVLEHIPTIEVENVLKSISSLNCKDYYFVISTRKSVLLDSKKNNLHLSVFNHDWWKSKINHFFNIKDEEILPTLYTVQCQKKQ